MKTRRELLNDQCTYVANVFMAMFPAATFAQCDMTMPEMIYVTVGLPQRVDPLHYLHTFGSDDDDYNFEPDDDNDPAYLMPIRFPDHVTAAANVEYPPDDDSVADDDVIEVTLQR